MSFLNTMPDDDTKVSKLKSYCLSSGGFYEATIDGFKFSIEHVDRKY